MSDTHFEHRMAAHCESGAVSALLQHAGMDIDEPMVFGVSGAIFFGYFRSAMFPFPTFVLRNKPGKIRTDAVRRLGARFKERRFRDPPRAMQALDDLLDKGIPVGIQVDLFYMDYVPAYARAHFNAHYIVVVGKEDKETYIVSDSYSPSLTRLSAKALRRARFARGPFAPRGLLFYPDRVPESVDYETAIRKGIKDAARYMLRMPIPLLGVRGIRRFAERICTWPKYTRDIDHLSHEVMMINVILEERGTGGGGFRFLFATFLQQAAERLNKPELADVAKTAMEDGDRWRDISLFAARIGKNRDLGPERLAALGDMIMERADAEKRIFSALAGIFK
jgi:hypothetical protein